MRSKIRWLAGLLAVVVLTFAVTGCNFDAAAKVNGVSIPKSKLEKRLEKQKKVMEKNGAKFEGESGKKMLDALRVQILEQLISEELTLQAAKKEGVMPSNKEIEERMDQIIKSFGSEEEFKKALKEYGYTEDDMREYLKVQLATNKLFEKVTRNVSVTDDEVKKYFEENKENYKIPEGVKVRHILIRFDTQNERVGRTEEKAKQEAEEILKKIKAGADFAQLAKEKSEDPGSKDNGGLLVNQATQDQYFSRDMLDKAFADAAFALKPGEITKEVVKSSYGYHIIKLEDKRPEKMPTFEEVRDKVKEDLLQSKKNEAFKKYLDDFKKKSKIEKFVSSSSK
ncbi:MAG: hypothetical protein PWQ91_8 [Eubacteriales bacterium]|nr:hypothetical protein [Eubacteriales bacterium]MDN5362947.1 hypothetical protein [Eubacteriales bacterium]